ncbi:hypothetical protein F2Q70_00000522 [Brassica cretica]|uniref:Glutaredoxin domain-containing protein n=1 Tax=Brassica cretica TaxID=69181 RepID=A0A8S9IUI9_BRACR|nr:hypothetical protein F2Q70_00000522 [Brassica cretica]
MKLIHKNSSNFAKRNNLSPTREAGVWYAKAEEKKAEDFPNKLNEKMLIGECGERSNGTSLAEDICNGCSVRFLQKLYTYKRFRREKRWVLCGNRLSKEEMEVVMNKAKEIVSEYPVVVFSKTYCGYCQRVKQVLTQLGATFKVLELDEMSDGGEIQSALSEWTGQSTVPNVFIKGKHIGGCDRVVESNKQGKLVPLLTEAGAIANNSSQL